MYQRPLIEGQAAFGTMVATHNQVVLFDGAAGAVETRNTGSAQPAAHRRPADW
ncbi:MAG: hypothetical protein WB579_06645 [Bryobacteraceae bacterium]